MSIGNQRLGLWSPQDLNENRKSSISSGFRGQTGIWRRYVVQALFFFAAVIWYLLALFLVKKRGKGSFEMVLLQKLHNPPPPPSPPLPCYYLSDVTIVKTSISFVCRKIRSPMCSKVRMTLWYTTRYASDTCEITFWESIF